MDNQQVSFEKKKLQRLERNLVPTSVGKWGVPNLWLGNDIVCA
ncbi:hypothetical protein WIS05_15425 [Clostridioides difficile]|uniref:Uncharacterized protein n=2 Tax=Clostridioides difficile TaxID=1496 RepID=A0A069AZB3_CLODI|nr:hypothetical protein [Clostridioides difficile]EQF58399.1 hypothetical protein QGC_3082 [Clostridioides difficile CD196]EQG58410.1 hypothetical protein QK5_3026 [Clostridioides difficile DA00149]EQK79824.1 hypothetical protein QEG_3175 [Clostridioides difficile CD127]CCL66340.1 conserved hypothetical protein [Clostridioides difficile E7]EFH06030.1 hypothetical protein HMPREF0220_2921 [Clostridioides difficile NAP08]